MSYGGSWGVWWGLGLERPAWSSLSPELIRDQEREGLLPAGSAAQLGGVIVTKRSRRTLRPELVVAAGPQRLAQPGGGTYDDLYGSRWALGLYRGGPRLYQARSGVWVDRTDPDALGALTASGVRHASLAFDQAARPVLAWEQSGAVYVRQWDALGTQYVTRGPWEGCDPLLISDAMALLKPQTVTLRSTTSTRPALPSWPARSARFTPQRATWPPWPAAPCWIRSSLCPMRCN
ncbi:hypothetical protein ACFQDE_16155 [Deinococcus caeni]|uniref:hypothetical protein n=1 Tax=Deinococcus caeni TaxID=569127 RepID=UPI00361FC3C7